MIDLKQWVQVLTDPVGTFKKHKKVELGTAFWSVVIAAVIAGVVTSLSVVVAILPYASLMGVYFGTTLTWAFTPMLTIPVYGVIGWLVFSWLVNFLAVNSKKKSDFVEVASLIATIFPPIVLLASVVVWIPIIGFGLRWLIVVYALYLVALAMNEYYKLGINLGMGTAKKGKK